MDPLNTLAWTVICDAFCCLRMSSDVFLVVSSDVWRCLVLLTFWAAVATPRLAPQLPWPWWLSRSFGVVGDQYSKDQTRLQGRSSQKHLGLIRHPLLWHISYLYSPHMALLHFQQLTDTSYSLFPLDSRRRVSLSHSGPHSATTGSDYR